LLPSFETYINKQQSSRQGCISFAPAAFFPTLLAHLYLGPLAICRVGLSASLFAYFRATLCAHSRYGRLVARDSEMYSPVTPNQALQPTAERLENYKGEIRK
jgi:hypothetical protein